MHLVTECGEFKHKGSRPNLFDYCCSFFISNHCFLNRTVWDTYQVNTNAFGCMLFVIQYLKDKITRFIYLLPKTPEHQQHSNQYEINFLHVSSYEDNLG